MDSQPPQPEPPAAKVEVPAVESEAAGAFESLDPRVISLWRCGHAISSIVLVGLSGVVLIPLALNLEGARIYLFGIWFGLLALRVWLYFWHPPRRYAHWGYRLDDRVLEIRHGIWFRTIQLVPLSRLQHVDLSRGPIERRFGLASLLLYTAGTHQAMIVIPGLAAEVAARLRDGLVAAGGDDAV
jgi:membrane protein YdbS with pleckstrin-like domain